MDGTGKQIAGMCRISCVQLPANKLECQLWDSSFSDMWYMIDCSETFKCKLETFSFWLALLVYNVFLQLNVKELFSIQFFVTIRINTVFIPWTWMCLCVYILQGEVENAFCDAIEIWKVSVQSRRFIKTVQAYMSVSEIQWTGNKKL